MTCLKADSGGRPKPRAPHRVSWSEMIVRWSGRLRPATGAHEASTARVTPKGPAGCWWQALASGKRHLNAFPLALQQNNLLLSVVQRSRIPDRGALEGTRRRDPETWGLTRHLGKVQEASGRRKSIWGRPHGIGGRTRIGLRFLNETGCYRSRFLRSLSSVLLSFSQ